MSKVGKNLALLAIIPVFIISCGTHANAATISLPAPVEWATAPAGAPTAPGDAYQISFTDPSGSVDPNAPSIGEWNRTTKPGESFTMTGARFTSKSGVDMGTDTTVWIWADTASGGTLRQAKIWKLTDLVITASVPDDVPFGMYLVWVENQYGPSKPICINRTQPQWVGPLGNSVQAGQTKRVIGKNVSHDHGSQSSNVYIQPASGGPLVLCPTTSVEPYAVEFTVPAGTSNGNYNIYMHNGHGGIYGWGDPLALTVASPWVRGTSEQALNPSGGDDTLAIQAAINVMTTRTNGGTVRLAAGTFTISTAVQLKPYVRLVGAGKDVTTIQVKISGTGWGPAIGIMGAHVALEDMTLSMVSNASTWHGDDLIAELVNSSTCNDESIRNFKLTQGSHMDYYGIDLWGDRCEMTGCDFYLPVSTALDSWVHDCSLYGGAYGDPWGGHNEYPFGSGIRQEGPRCIFEHCFISTPNWPRNPANGSRNYKTWLGDYWTEYYMQWAKRMCGPANLSYIAHNSTMDVACEDNKGEMILFHGSGGYWVGQCLSTTGSTTTVRTDGLVDGQAYSVYNYVSGNLQAGQTVPLDKVGWPFVIVAGTGVGQMRHIASCTSNSVTVDTPWRVPPDATSRAVITGMYENTIIYDNDLNAFPAGYDFTNTQSASTGIDLDANCFMFEAEANDSHRTVHARQMKSFPVGPSLFNTMRNESSYETAMDGNWTSTYTDNPIGYGVIGNRYVGGMVQMTGPAFSWPTWMAQSCEIGNIMENMTLTGYPCGLYVDQESLYKNNTVNMQFVTAAPEPVYLSTTNANPTLINNTYSGASQTYYLVSGCSFAQKPLAPTKLVRFSGSVGSSTLSQIVSVANAGIASMAWNATPSDSWITATIQANGTLAAESTLGRLVVGVNTSGLSEGKHWGSVTIGSGAQSTKIGVLVVLSSGTPANHVPVSSFTTTPSAGTAPLTVAFDASTSSDPDGSVTDYSWDFGDGTYGTGVTTSHCYAVAGVYTPVLTVSDNCGLSGTGWTNLSVMPQISSVTLSGNPRAPVDSGTNVTLTASATGGYQVQYRFMANNGTGWSVLRDYQTGSAFSWSPSTSGYYSIKVQAKSSDSTKDYDCESQVLGYPVGLIPTTGIALWLRSETGVTADPNNQVSAWSDLTANGNNVAQSFSGYQPTRVPDSGNSRPAVRFAPGNNTLNSAGRVISGTTAFTCFAVMKYNSQTMPSTNQFIFWNGADTTNGGYGWYLDTVGRPTASWGGYSGMVYDSASIVPGQWYVFSSRWQSNMHQFWVNGVSKGTFPKSGSSFSSGFFSVGNKGPAPSQGLDGDIQEVIVYNRGLSDIERANVESYLNMRYVPQAKTTVPSVKSLANGSLVSITAAKTATAASTVFSDGSYYIEEPDRSSGMKVMGTSGLPAVAEGDQITLTGSLGTDANGEKTLYLSRIDSKASGTALGALGMANKSVSGTGILVRAWGQVTQKTSTYMIINDGSTTGLRVELGGTVLPITASPNIGDYVGVTGNAGLATGGIPTIRLRSDSDVYVFPQN